MPTTSSPITPRPPFWKTLLLRRLKFLGLLIGLIVALFGGSYAFAPQWLLAANDYRLASMAHLDKKQILAGDTHWVYYEGGKGPTLLLLHGFNSSKEVWLPVAEQLGRQFHLVIPDLPGWGESSQNPSANYRLQAQADRLEDFVQALHLPGMVVAGHSMGGEIAAFYTMSHPEHVAGLMLIAAAGLKAKPSATSRLIAGGQNPFLYHDRAGLQRALALAFEHPPNIPGRIQDALIAQNQRHRDFIARSFQLLQARDQAQALQSRLDQLVLPVMGLWCRDDQVVDYSALESLRAGLTRATSISSTTMLGCGHMPMLEKPKEVAQILTHFALMR